MRLRVAHVCRVPCGRPGGLAPCSCDRGRMPDIDRGWRIRSGVSVDLRVSTCLKPRKETGGVWLIISFGLRVRVVVVRRLSECSHATPPRIDDVANRRKQFKVPIADFGGIKEVLARATSNTLMCVAGGDLMNAIVDNHEAPMIISSIMKQNTTERGQ